MNFTNFKYPRVLPLALLLLIVGTLVLRQFPAWRVDLTEESLFSLSDGTTNIVSSLQEPLTLQLFFSESVAADFPQLMDYGQRVNDLLNEYVALNPSHLKLKLIDPEPFSEEEDSATSAGITGAPVSMGGESFYLGLAVSREDGTQEVIEFFNPERESFLEYDISQLIYRVSQSAKPVIGVLSQLQVMGGYDFRSGGMTPAWMALEQLKGFAEIKAVTADQGTLDTDVDVLLLIHPQALTDMQLYAVDQYVIAGGKAVVFVDPHAEIAAQGQPTANASEFERLLSAWGVEFNPTKIVGDRQWALRIPSAANQVPMPHVGIIGLQAQGLDDESLVTAELEVINVSSAGSLKQSLESTTEFTPLLRTSTKSKLFDATEYIGTRDHSILLNGFEDLDESLTIAARIQGSVKSAFKAQPEAEVIESEGGEAEALKETSEPIPEYIAASKEPINVLIVADTDMLSDRLWVQVSNFMGQRMAMPWASNGDFIANAVELMAGSDDLIGLRSRGQYSRSFTRVNDLRVEAAEKFKEQEQNLTGRLTQLEAEISSLSPDTNAQNEPVLSAEQEQAIEKFESERLQIRKQLRQVQHQLNSSINELEARLKLINIFLVPILLLALMLVVRLRRPRD